MLNVGNLSADIEFELINSRSNVQHGVCIERQRERRMFQQQTERTNATLVARIAISIIL